MRKFALALVITVLVLPVLCGVAARYYLNNHLAQNLPKNLEIKAFKLESGWFSSRLQADIALSETNLRLPIQGVISHGPIVWKNLSRSQTNIASLFGFYQLDANLNLPNSDSEPASMQLWVSFLGNLSARFSHWGFNTQIANTRIYGDAIQINASHNLNGSILAQFSGNQIEMTHNENVIYVTQLKGQSSAVSEQTFPDSILAEAASVIAQLTSNDNIELVDLALSSQVVKSAQDYQYQARLDANSAQINQVLVSELKIDLQVERINPQLVQFWQAQQAEILAAINNNQLLIVLKFLTDALKLAGPNEPQIELGLSAWYDKQLVEFKFSSQMLDKPINALDPFGLLDNLALTLKASLPEKLVRQARQGVIQERLNSLSNQGWLIRQKNTYHADISFENSKFKVNNTKL